MDTGLLYPIPIIVIHWSDWNWFRPTRIIPPHGRGRLCWHRRAPISRPTEARTVLFAWAAAWVGLMNVDFLCQQEHRDISVCRMHHWWCGLGVFVTTSRPDQSWVNKVPEFVGRVVVTSPLKLVNLKCIRHLQWYCSHAQGQLSGGKQHWACAVCLIDCVSFCCDVFVAF